MRSSLFFRVQILPLETIASSLASTSENSGDSMGCVRRSAVGNVVGRSGMQHVVEDDGSFQ